MDRLDTINSYFNQKERARLNALVQDAGGLPSMTKEEIKLSCIENDGYESPELNDKLYLHFRGFKRIENLEEYTSCKAIWLDSNGFEFIENIGHMPLRCLYLSKNLINQMRGLENLSQLVTLDLSNNRITDVHGLEGCSSLKTINLSRNALSTAEGLEGLLACPTIDNIDITNNRIEGDVTSVLCQLPELHALSINGNPCTQTPAFRKRMIAAISTLCYLDRPVDEIEKVGAHAFVTEGPEKEQEVRLAFIAKQKQDRSDELQQFRTWQREQLALRKEKMAAGETEGLNLITEFTPEEKAEREAEAQRAADLEKEMLEMGIGKLGQKYWQMQGRADGKDDRVDILEKVVEELKTAKEDQQRAEEEYQGDEAVETTDVRVELESDQESCGGGGGINDIDEDEDEVEDVHKVQIESDDDEVDSVDLQNCDEEENKLTVEGVTSHDDNIEDLSLSQEVEGEGAVTDEVMNDGDEEPKWVHQQRVQESIEIYNRQRRMEKLKQGQGGAVNDPAGPSVETFSTTQTTIDWNFETSKKLDDVNDGSKVYWTEWMDLKLAELVQSCVFDFSAIAECFTEIADSDEFLHLPAVTFGVGKHTKEILHALSAEDCRVRWAELDSKQWCGTDGDETSSDTPNNGIAPAVYKICVQPDVLGKGHGAQPTFAAMSSMSTGFSSYLKVPTSFPSVSDDDDDDADCSPSYCDERFESLD